MEEFCSGIGGEPSRRLRPAFKQEPRPEYSQQQQAGQPVQLEQAQQSELKPHAQAHLLSPTDKCKVCNEPAAKHVHYGAMTCFSCRAFFRRSIQNKTAATYVCRRSKNCEINLRTRKNCQFCRYARCIGVGMKPTWVLSEEERHRRFRKNRDKGEPGAGPGSSKQGGGYPAGTSADPGPQFGQEFSLDSGNLEGEALLAGVLEQTERFGDNNIPVILEKPKVVIKQEKQTGSVEPLAPAEFFTELQSGPCTFPPQQQILVKRESCGEGMERAGQQMLVYSQPGQQQQQVSRASLVPVQPGLQHHSVVQQSLAPSPAKLSVIVQPGPRPAVVTTAQYHQPTLQHNNLSLVSNQQTMQFLPDTSFPLAMESFNKVRGASRADITEDWDSNYEDDVFSSDEDEGAAAIAREILRNEPEIKFTAGEQQHLEMLVQHHHERYRSVNFGEELIKEMIMCSMFGIPVSTSAAINGYRLSVERITRIAHNLEFFTDLSKTDQNNLLKENADLLVNLRGAIFFDSKKKGVDQVLISMGIDDLQTIKTMFTPLLKENSMKHIDYKTFNSIQTVANPAVESRYSFLQAKVAELIDGDDILTVLTTYIILFSADFCSLVDTRRVEQTQDRYLRMLQRYIYSREPRRVACTNFANVLGAMTFLREMADIKKSRAINVNVKV